LKLEVFHSAQIGPNPRSEYPNPKQIQNLKSPMFKTLLGTSSQFSRFGNWDFGHSDLFRIWCLGFGIYELVVEEKSLL